MRQAKGRVLVPDPCGALTECGEGAGTAMFLPATAASPLALCSKAQQTTVFLPCVYAPVVGPPLLGSHAAATIYSPACPLAP